jgi:hypothetical protein
MSRIIDEHGSLNTLKPQPGQYDSYTPRFHPLPGKWAAEQLAGKSSSRPGSTSGEARPSTDLQRALSAERGQHEYWEQWQGVTPGKPIYEDPRAFQNTLLPVARFGTNGRGD